VWSVGKNAYGEFGDGYAVEAMSSTPKKMNNITKAVRTAQGQFTTCVLLNDGTVWCAGSDQFGGIGDGDSTDVDALEPRKVKDLVGIIDIKAISRINIALDKNGDVWTWGWGYYGLGSSAGGVPNARTPQKITTLKNIIAISGSNDGIHFLALDSSKNCYAWGTNSWGNCGDGTDSIIYSAKIVATDVVEIMAGETFSYIVKSDGTLWAAGKSNINGSIWLNIPDINRKTFTKINPCTDSFKLCCPISLDFIDTFKLPLIDPLDETNVIFFPNAFSPNNDLINDEFKGIISSKYLIENYSLSIFNRWGNLIFSTKDINFGWNGKSGNQDAPIETYFYLAEYNLKNRNKNIQKGDLILIR
jgi:gliding motility-associated-like protein